MSRKPLASISSDRLVDMFAETALAEDEAILMDDNTKYNRLFWRMEAIEDELKVRNGDHRRELLRLYNHSNAQVRLTAAKATLAVAPEAARQLLQAIYESKEYPQAGDAGMSIWNLDRGVFKPT